jgi:hypothetical protein
MQLVTSSIWTTFVAVALVIAISSGCGGSPNAPSQTSFTGHWVGSYVVLRCVTVGWTSCDAARAEKNVEQVNGDYPLDLSLTQSNSAVAGTARLAYSTIPVTGTVSGNTLTLTGRFDTADNRSENDSVFITQWTTSGGSDGMRGTFSLRWEITWGLANVVHPPGRAELDYDAQIFHIARVGISP